MAVTKIHRTSRTVLLIGIVISLVVLGLFYLGGQVPAHQKIAADMSQPKFTDIVLYWAYVLLAVTLIVLLLFAIVAFFKQMKESPKKAMGGLLILVGLAALLIVTYVIGDGTLLNIPGYDGNDNRPPTLKMTDMWLYSAYFMFTMTILAMVILPLFKKRK
ncbi:hypothetical protein [Proteiniphilum sp. X52]|uniref:hypothetical protein n=1 Tax=Proteiniphilum sp. X52 TaxID=2382159 RepID=UPI000F0A46C9|nr:hypothetical protein [Proteiniphilum sp. X52]RNC65890.1 hypothetical protein D7D25_05050 [Proteiniphilum sp. X52]